MSPQDLILAYDNGFTTVMGDTVPPTEGGAEDFTEKLKGFKSNWGTPASATVLIPGAGPSRGPPPFSFNKYVVSTRGGEDPPGLSGEPKEDDDDWMQVLGRSIYYQDNGPDDYDELAAGASDDNEHHGGYCHGHLDEADSGSPYTSFIFGAGDSILEFTVDR
jgi:hypothetical protein